TPQGGILSPLLSNIVLNELDWWIASQWETLETKHQYSAKNKKSQSIENNKPQRGVHRKICRRFQVTVQNKRYC
ncbi:MAG: group II intron reverse transcriptase/maturase, partial [Bacillaceae bacterium]|nr:group II intron reverse transcriptase/maturase [Bacillaceae bacterium]